MAEVTVESDVQEERIKLAYKVISRCGLCIFMKKRLVPSRDVYSCNCMATNKHIALVAVKQVMLCEGDWEESKSPAIPHWCPLQNVPRTDHQLEILAESVGERDEQLAEPVPAEQKRDEITKPNLKTLRQRHLLEELMRPVPPKP